jgi:hypothetical protein
MRNDPAGTAVPAGRACCCPATAVVRVVMPPTPARPHETDLLLCGHHYRMSLQALTAAHAIVIPVAGDAGETPQALLPELPGPCMPVSTWEGEQS